MVSRRALLALTLPLGSSAAGLAWARYEGRASGQLPAALTGISLRDQRGQALGQDELGGGPLVVNFIFTRCGSVCPTQTRELAKARQLLAPSVQERVRFVSVSLDPEHDTPAELTVFAEANHAAHANWFFVAAPAPVTQRLVERLQLGAAPSDAAAADNLVNHGTAIYLFDGSGRLMQRYSAPRPLKFASITRPRS